MYLLKEKQRCLLRSLVRDFSRQNGRKIQVKPKYRLQPEIANLVSRRTTVRTAVYILPAFHSIQTFWSVYYPLPSYLRNFPIEDVQYYYSRQQNLVKKRFNSKWRNIHILIDLFAKFPGMTYFRTILFLK
jgi:hypothetical protein